jgi:hypothetical protein
METPAERVEPPASPAPSAPRSPREPGRGGAEHKYLQGLIRAWAQARGFRADIEHELSDGGRVDVALVRDNVRIACEIASHSTIENELGNIAKCLAASFDRVVVVSLDRRFLDLLEPAVAGSVDPAVRGRVSLMAPEELCALIDNECGPVAADRVAGYAVSVKYRGAVDDAAKARRSAIAQVLARSRRRLAGKG